MNSIAFVRDARKLLNKIAAVNLVDNADDKAYFRKQNQLDLDYLLNNMTNPSLPTAYKLVVTAHRQKYNVDSRYFHRVNQFA